MNPAALDFEKVRQGAPRWGVGWPYWRDERAQLGKAEDELGSSSAQVSWDSGCRVQVGETTACLTSAM